MGFTVLVPEDRGERLLTDLLPGHLIVRYDAGDELSPKAEVFVPPFAPSPELIERALRLPRLRMVQLLTVGADTWSERMPAGVTLSTCRSAHSVAAAEWVLTVLLATFRGLPAFLAESRERAWRPRPTIGLSGRRVLVVGAGDVGRTVAARLVALGCTVTLVGRRGGDGVHPVSELPNLLGRHDAVVLVVPLTAQTRGMVDARFLASMPDGAVLVNGARGPVVDTAALLAELRSGRLSAALDVTDPEPLPPDHDLWAAPNLIVTPHVGGAVHGLYERAYRVAASQIAAFAAGEQPPNVVSNGY